MSALRLSSWLFAFWAVLFVGFPTFTNEFAGIGYTNSGHAKDWTQLVGLLCIGYSALLERAHRSDSFQFRRAAAWSVASSTFPCALLMTYWQLIPERRWTRLDLINVGLLYALSIGLPLITRQRDQTAA